MRLKFGVAPHLAALLLIMCHKALASPARCEWVDAVTREDHQARYYIGVSSNASTEAAGLAEALNSAWENALRENFGMVVQVSRQIVADMSKTQLFRRATEDSDEVRMVEFLETKRCVLDSSGHFNVWLLFRFPKAEIEKEKRRLAEVKRAKKITVEYSVSGFEKPGAGSAEFESNPFGAKVFIDGEQYGRTPLRVSGILTSGKHTYLLDHPAFEPSEGTFLIGTTVTRIREELKPAYGEVIIRTDPANATVMINGKPAGITPTRKLKLEANVQFSISISHPEVEPISIQLAVERDTLTERVIPLFLKPAQLSVFSSPSGATVWLDGHVIGVTPLSSRTLLAGSHNLLLHRDGYEDERRDIALRGNENRQVTVSLQRGDDSEESDSVRDPSSYEGRSQSDASSGSSAGKEIFGPAGNTPWTLGLLSVGEMGTTYQGLGARDSYLVGFFLERRIFRRIGLLYEFDSMSDSGVEGRQRTWGFPIYFGSEPGEGFFIMPEIKGRAKNFLSNGICLVKQLRYRFLDRIVFISHPSELGKLWSIHRYLPPPHLQT